MTLSSEKKNSPLRILEKIIRTPTRLDKKGQKIKAEVTKGQDMKRKKMMTRVETPKEPDMVRKKVMTKIETPTGIDMKRKEIAIEVGPDTKRNIAGMIKVGTPKGLDMKRKEKRKIMTRVGTLKGLDMKRKKEIQTEPGVIGTMTKIEIKNQENEIGTMSI